MPHSDYTWTHVDDGCLSFGPPQRGSLDEPARIAAFDLDHTLITTKSGKVHPRTSDDWKWIPCVVDKLTELSNAGWFLVIFTNQKLSATRTEEFVKAKISAIVTSLPEDVQICTFVATLDNEYRKPAVDMWVKCVTWLGAEEEGIDTNSIFVGDAAGRPAAWDGNPKTKKDFANTDREFAVACGFNNFATPEAFFHGKPEWIAPPPPPQLDKSKPGVSRASSTQELVLLIGSPASGKSTFVERSFEPYGYLVVSQDKLGTKTKCHKAVKDALTAGRSVVVDNTNPSSTGRAEFIAIAKGLGKPVRCFWIQTDVQTSKCLNIRRETEGGKKHVPDIVYSVYKKAFVEPTEEEGFSEVTRVAFEEL